MSMLLWKVNYKITRHNDKGLSLEILSRKQFEQFAWLLQRQVGGINSALVSHYWYYLSIVVSVSWIMLLSRWVWVRQSIFDKSSKLHVPNVGILVALTTILACKSLANRLIEIWRDTLVCITRGDTVSVLTRDFIKFVNSGWHGQSIFVLHRGILNNIDGAPRRNCG